MKIQKTRKYSFLNINEVQALFCRRKPTTNRLWNGLLFDFRFFCLIQ